MKAASKRIDRKKAKAGQTSLSVDAQLVLVREQVGAQTTPLGMNTTDKEDMCMYATTSKKRIYTKASTHFGFRSYSFLYNIILLHRRLCPFVPAEAAAESGGREEGHPFVEQQPEGETADEGRRGS